MWHKPRFCVLLAAWNRLAGWLPEWMDGWLTVPLSPEDGADSSKHKQTSCTNPTVAFQLCFSGNLYLYLAICSVCPSVCTASSATFIRKDPRGIQEEVGLLLRSPPSGTGWRPQRTDQRCVGSGGGLGWCGCVRDYLSTTTLHVEWFLCCSKEPNGLVWKAISPWMMSSYLPSHRTHRTDWDRFKTCQIWVTGCLMSAPNIWQTVL